MYMILWVDEKRKHVETYSRRLGGGCNVLRLGLGEVSKRAANLKLIFFQFFSKID